MVCAPSASGLNRFQISVATGVLCAAGPFCSSASAALGSVQTTTGKDASRAPMLASSSCAALRANSSARVLGAEGTRCNTDPPGIAVRKRDDCSPSFVPDSAFCRLVRPKPCRSLGETGQMSLSHPASKIRGGGDYGDHSGLPPTWIRPLMSTAMVGRGRGVVPRSLVEGRPHPAGREPRGLGPSSQSLFQAASGGRVRQGPEGVTFRQRGRQAQELRCQDCPARTGGGQTHLHHQGLPRRRCSAACHHPGRGSQFPVDELQARLGGRR